MHVFSTDTDFKNLDITLNNAIEYWVSFNSVNIHHMTSNYHCHFKKSLINFIPFWNKRKYYLQELYMNYTIEEHWK